MSFWLNQKVEIRLQGLILLLSIILVFSTWRGYASNKVAAVSLGASVTSPASRLQSENKTTETIVILSLDEVAKHQNPSDCWIVVKETVYNATAYLDAHPGGAAILSQFCGGDATVGFDTKGGRGSHSGLAQSLLSKLAVGKIGQAVSYDPAKFSPVTNVNLKFSSGKKGGFEKGEEDD